MTWYRRLSDRRGRLRFELVGELAAVFGTAGDCEVAVGATQMVRLVDISMTGAQLRSTHEAPIGQRGELRTKLGDYVFVAPVEIRRVVAVLGREGVGGGFGIGVTFLALDSDNRRCLERFLRQPMSA